MECHNINANPQYHVANLQLAAESEHHDHISNLPTELIEAIFKFFPKDHKSLRNFMRTGKKFNKIGLNSLSPQVRGDLLITATRIGNAPTVQKLLTKFETGKDDEINLHAALDIALMNGKTDIVKVFLNNSMIDPSEDDNSAIKWACIRGHLNIVQLLLKHPKVDPSDDDNSCIKSAIYGRMQNIILALVEDPRVDGSIGNNTVIESYISDFELLKKSDAGANELERIELCRKQISTLLLNPSIVNSLSAEHTIKLQKWGFLDERFQN